MGCDRADEPDKDAGLVTSMVAYQAGELVGFEELYAALAGDLERFFAAAQGGEVTKDLVQETFLELHRSRRSYLSPLPVRPWVFGLARNVLRRHRRAAWRRARLENAPTPVLSPPAWKPKAPSSNGFSFDAKDVEEALRSLPSTRREVWVLHHMQGWSFEEIAARLGIGVNAAKLRSSRAMRALRGALGVVRLLNRRAKDGRDRDGREGGDLD
jgi:RNA polymerase sigma factor (sigma-70 family)